MSSEGSSKTDARRFREEFSEFAEEFKGESDRAAVILGAAKIDQLLGMILEKFLLPCPNSTDNLFANNGPLGTFSAKIDFSYRLGLVDASFARSIHLIRRIRNDFAHEVYGARLDSGSHKDRVKALVAEIKDHKWFALLKRDFFDDEKSYRADFSTALGLVIARLDGKIGYLESLSPDFALTLTGRRNNKQSQAET